jgi:glycosyltransferase involved in cell wall biosynthesis
MKNKKIDIVVCSKGSYEDTLIQKSFYNLNYGNFCLKIVENNSRAISEVYNEYMDTSDADYIVFCHDDISIEDSQLAIKINEAIGDDSEFVICGIAGNRKCQIKEKNLWHLMGDRKTMSGSVAHYTGKDDVNCFSTSFGPTPERCILLDGLFLAVNLKEIKEAGLRFDEDCPSKWNFYDLNFCMQAHRLGLKMTTYPIWVVHQSHGLEDYNNDDWVKGNEYFKNKWS